MSQLQHTLEIVCVGGGGGERERPSHSEMLGGQPRTCSLEQ